MKLDERFLTKGGYAQFLGFSLASLRILRNLVESPLPAAP
jgi:hypothetical protein